MNTNDTLIWCMNYYSDTGYFLVSTNQRPSSLKFLFADKSSRKMEYTWTPKRMGSFEVGLRRQLGMKFNSLSGCVDFTSSLSKDSRL